MKKFLTVLLVIAVMFTFSFSSAFATVNYAKGQTDLTQMAVAQDFYNEGAVDKSLEKTYGLTTYTDYGTLGVTTEGKDRLLEMFDAKIDAAEGFDSAYDYTNYYGSKEAVESESVFYVNKVAKEFGGLVDFAKQVGAVVTSPTNANVKDFAKYLYVGAEKFVMTESGLPVVLNEYSTLPEGVQDFMSNAEAKELTALWTEAKADAEKATAAAAISKIYKKAGKAADAVTAKYEAYEKQIVKYATLKVNAKLLDGMYLVPNYGRFVFNGLNKNYSLALGQLTPNEQHAVICWLLDNGYTTKASFAEGTAKFVEALVPYSTWSKDYSTDLKALAKKIANINQSLLIAKSTETKLADVAALYDERDAFLAKYAVTQDLLTPITEAGIDIELTGIANLVRQEIAAAVLTNADAIKALNMVYNTMTDAETTEAIKLANELYANFYALYDENNNADVASVMQKIYPIKVKMITKTTEYAKGNYVYPIPYGLDLNLETVLLYAKDTYALKLLTSVAPSVEKAIKDLFDEKNGVFGFKEVTEVTDTKGTYYVFDETTANLKAIKDAREAVDKLFATYGDLVDVFNTVPQAKTEYNAARLLAAEYNAKLAAKGYADEIAALQASLNNAKVTVKTQALGKGKIRVQATLDASTWANINDVNAKVNEDYTVTYKFYKKKATAAKYKGYSDRAVNYTTFKGLKKGTKYQFKCAILVKNSDGEVVATRDFTGSTTGTRTAK